MEVFRALDCVAWFGIAGTVGTCVFAGVAFYQFIRGWRDKSVREAHREHLLAVQTELEAIRAMYAEAIKSEEVTNAPATKPWVRQLAYTLAGIERHLDAAVRRD